MSCDLHLGRLVGQVRDAETGRRIAQSVILIATRAGRNVRPGLVSEVAIGPSLPDINPSLPGMNQPIGAVRHEVHEVGHIRQTTDQSMGACRAIRRNELNLTVLNPRIQSPRVVRSQIIAEIISEEYDHDRVPAAQFGNNELLKDCELLNRSRGRDAEILDATFGQALCNRSVTTCPWPTPHPQTNESPKINTFFRFGEAATGRAALRNPNSSFSMTTSISAFFRCPVKFGRPRIPIRSSLS